jgi:N-acetylneuraminate synthase/N,N'-diacetyllegionaminate synthase
MNIAGVDLLADVLVIAEIGNNHEGDFGLAAEMIAAVAATGANAVKFQTIEPARLVSPSQVARIKQLSKYAFNQEEFLKLAEIARAKGIMFLSTPFTPSAVPWLDKLVPAFKISSGDNNFSQLLEAVAATGKPILLSTGMTDLEGINQSCETIKKAAQMAGHAEQTVLLHCVSAYPTPPEQANLRAISTLARETGMLVGYSDHTLGIEAAVMSVALGARVIEKHFTLNRALKGTDHAFSLEPQGLGKLVRDLRRASEALGDGEKVIYENERAPIRKMGKMIVAKRFLTAGTKISRDDIELRSPADGLAPDMLDKVLGSILKNDVGPYEPILAGSLVDW